MGLTTEQLLAEVPGLMRYARALTRDPDAAQDLTQDVVVRALERADTFRGESSPATWLHRIMHHHFVDEVRRRTADPVADEVLLRRADEVETLWQADSYTVDADAVLARAAAREEVWDALTHLPVILRSAVVLHDLEGLTSPDVAHVQGISLAAAKQRLLRGRAMLVSVLAEGPARRRASRGVPMHCWEARAKVGDYLDDELTASERAAVEGHLTACPTCPALVASLVGVRDALGSMRDPESVIPPALRARLQAQEPAGTWPAPAGRSDPSSRTDR